MALQNNQDVKPAATGAMAQRNELKPAEGWANISLVDAIGNEHRVKAGIPLYKDQDRVHKALLNRLEQMQKDAVANGQQPPTQMKVNLTAVISLAEPSREIQWELPAQEAVEAV